MKILVTGVNGLMGRIIYKYLTQDSSYEIYGTDIHNEYSDRYRMERRDHVPLDSMPQEKLFILNLADRTKLSILLQKHRFDCVIHLAGLLENRTKQEIESTNLAITRNVFELAAKNKVKKIIFASSVMAAFGYFEDELYRPILEQNTPPRAFPLINCSMLPKPAKHPPSDHANSLSKIACEQLARDVIQHSTETAILCARFLWVTVNDADQGCWEDSCRCSHHDVRQFIDKALTHPWPQQYITCFVGSITKHEIFDFTNPIGFEPTDYR